MRDAQSLLDQIISFSGQQVAGEDVRDVLGFIPSDILDRTLDALADRDSKALLENVGIVIDQGLNIQQYVREFIGRIRDLLVLKLGLDDNVLGSAEEKQLLAAAAERFSEQDLIRVFDMLLRLENELRWTSQAKFHLEVGFIKLAKIGYVRDIEELIRESKQSGTAPPARPAPLASRAPASRAPAPVTKDPKRVEKVAEPAPPAGAAEGTFAEVFTRLVEDKFGTTAIYLQKAERITRTETGIEIVMAPGTPLAMLQSKEHKIALDTVAGEVLGKAVSVSLIIEGQALSSGPAADSVREEPLVKKFLEVFRGDVAQVKPSKGE
jgi:DNA polymerase III gamma/tau subunit